MRRTADYFIPDDREYDQRDNPDDHLRYDIARVVEAATARGGHPEAAPILERELCAVAGLPGPLPERNDAQHELPLP